MSENVQAVPIDPGQPSQRHASTWQDVADKMHEWPDPLQEHARRHLEAHGIAAPDRRDIAVAAMAGTVNQSESSLPSRPEQRKTTEHERQEAFAFGLRTFYKLTADPNLHVRLQDAGIDPFGENIETNAKYWRIVSEFAKNRIAAYRKSSGDNLNLRSLEIFAATPAYLFEQRALEEGKRNDSGERRQSMIAISNLHNLLVDYATDFPDVKADELSLQLLNVPNRLIRGKDFKQWAANDLRNRVRAVQHEVGFEDMLRQSGMPYRRATGKEDASGFDFIMNEGNVMQRKLDVKASLYKLGRDDAVSPVMLREEGVYAVYSMIVDREFRGGFHLSNDAAREKAQELLKRLYNVGPIAQASTA
jgi:hypothetical protein